MHLVLRRGCVELVDNILSDDLLLRGKAILHARLGRRCRLARQAKCNAALGENFVSRLNEVVGFGHSEIGDGLIQDFLHFNRSDSDVECSTHHCFVLTNGLRRDDGRQLKDEPGLDRQLAVAQDLVEGKVVEDLNQLWIGHRYGRDVAGKKLIVLFFA